MKTVHKPTGWEHPITILEYVYPEKTPRIRELDNPYLPFSGYHSGPAQPSCNEESEDIPPRPKPTGYCQYIKPNGTVCGKQIRVKNRLRRSYCKECREERNKEIQRKYDVKYNKEFRGSRNAKTKGTLYIKKSPYDLKGITWRDRYKIEEKIVKAHKKHALDRPLTKYRKNNLDTYVNWYGSSFSRDSTADISITHNGASYDDYSKYAERIYTETEGIMKCPECGGDIIEPNQQPHQEIKTDYESYIIYYGIGDTVCSKCGLVYEKHKEPPLYPQRSVREILKEAWKEMKMAENQKQSICYI